MHISVMWDIHYAQGRRCNRKYGKKAVGQEVEEGEISRSKQQNWWLQRQQMIRRVRMKACWLIKALLLTCLNVTGNNDSQVVFISEWCA